MNAVPAGSVDQERLFEYLLRLGDNALVNGQRLSEWCGHGPFLEEDIALANCALDLIGRARLLLDYAGRVEGRGRTEDDLAYLRDERAWRNVIITELPGGDFAFTIARQYLLDTYHHLFYERLCGSVDATLAGIAQKAVKECAYHVRRTSDWMLRLGDGTPESRARVDTALQTLWPYTGELFEGDDLDAWASAAGIGPDPAGLLGPWLERTGRLLAEATLVCPDCVAVPCAGRQGRHSEHMGHLLAEMQFLQRAYPGLQW